MANERKERRSPSRPRQVSASRSRGKSAQRGAANNASTRSTSTSPSAAATVSKANAQQQQPKQASQRKASPVPTPTPGSPTQPKPQTQQQATQTQSSDSTLTSSLSSNLKTAKSTQSNQSAASQQSHQPLFGHQQSSGLSNKQQPATPTSTSTTTATQTKEVNHSTKMASRIKSIKARQIYDSRGNPTVEVDLTTEEGQMFRAAVPSGASTGVHEALELRDKEKGNWHGKGVLKAVNHVNATLAPAVIAKNFNVINQAEVDKFMLELDGTENKSKFGANAILGISLAVCKAGAHAKSVPLYQHIADLAGVKELVLPVPAFNVINGGSHAGNALAMQEFMILPTGASSFSEAMKIGSEVFQHLKNVIKEQYGLEATCVGDEGGFAPNIQNNKQGLELIKTAIERAGYTGKVEIGMDVAASEFYKDNKYDLLWKTKESSPDKYLTGDQLGDVYKSFIAEYPIVSIEDPFDQDDWDSWSKLTGSVQIQIVGDDLTVTNPKRIKTAVEKKSCNALLLKVNQIGTVTESIEAHNLAKASGWGTMISHRSGETEDTFIADLTVGLSTGQIKTGAPCRSERLAKYNQILRIEEELGSKAKFAGKNFRRPLK